uniref:Uncharacterized protein n=1 Tax=Meloidogyne incognita TaxID=6306 RepID=A0A914LC41_MELIC
MDIKPKLEPRDVELNENIAVNPVKQGKKRKGDDDNFQPNRLTKTQRRKLNKMNRQQQNQQQGGNVQQQQRHLPQKVEELNENIGALNPVKKGKKKGKNSNFQKLTKLERLNKRQQKKLRRAMAEDRRKENEQSTGSGNFGDYSDIPIQRREQIANDKDWKKWKDQKEKEKDVKEKKKKQQQAQKPKKQVKFNVANDETINNNNETSDKPKTRKQRKLEARQNLTAERLKTLRNSIKELLKFRQLFKNDETILVKNVEYQQLCTLIASIIPSLLQPRKFNRLNMLKYDDGMLNEIVKQAALLEPKLFTKASVFNFNKIEENQNEKKNLQLQLRVLWALSASVCIFGYVSINKRSKDECMSEVEELCLMAEDLKQHPETFNCSALVDLLISWQMSFNAKYKVLPDLAMFVFVMRLNGNNIQQIMEALCNDETNNSAEENDEEEDEYTDFEMDEESSDEDEEEIEGDDDENEKQSRKETKKEIVEVDENGVSKKGESKEDKKVKKEKVDNNDKLNAKQVEEIRKALGDACFGEDDLSDGSDDWNLDDERLFALDDELIETFKKRSSSKQDLKKLKEFRGRLVDMLTICFTVAKLELALPAWLSTIAMLCERKDTIQDIADSMAKIEKPLIRRKKECNFDKKQLAIFLRALIAPFQKGDNDVRLYSRHNQKMVFGAIRVLVCISSDYPAKQFSPEIYRFITDMWAFCDNNITDEQNYYNDKEFVRKLLLQIFNNFKQFFNDWFLPLSNDAINNEFSFTKRLTSLHLLTYLISGNNLKSHPNVLPSLVDKFVEFFGPNNKNNNCDDDEEVKPPKKKKIKKEIEDNNNQQQEANPQINKIKILYLVKFVQVFGKIVEILKDEQEKKLILRKLYNGGINDLEVAVERTVGDEGIKILQRKIAYNDIYWTNDNNTKLPHLGRPLPSYLSSYLKKIMEILKKDIGTV